jgi:hypothetical protein
MNVLIVYNIKASIELKKSIVEELKKIGYYDSWFSDNNSTRKKLFLPPNTLWKKDTEIKVPLQELNTILRKLDIPESDLLNCIIVPASPWNGISGKQAEII